MRNHFCTIVILFFRCTLYWFANSALAQDADTVGVHRVKDNVSCLYGFKNAKGNWIIVPQFISAGNFIGRYAIVKSQEKYGVINCEGKFMLPMVYEELFHIQEDKGGFHSLNEEKREEEMSIEGLYIFLKDKKYGIIRANGTILIPAVYNAIDPYFQEGFGRIQKDTLWGFADTLGYVIEPQYSGVSLFENDIAHVSKIGKQGTLRGYINKKGNYVLPPDLYSDIRYNNHSRLFSFKKNNKWGIFNREGIIVKPDFEYAAITYNDFIIVKRNGKYGVVNHEGKYIIPLKYDSLRSWTNDKVFFSKKGLYGILNKTNGNKIVNSIYEEIDNSIETWIALVKAKGKYGLIDTSSNVLLPPIYDSIDYSNSESLTLFKEGVLKRYSLQEKNIEEYTTADIGIFGNQENRSGVVNREGKIILPPYYTISRTDSSLFFYNSSGYGLMSLKGDILVHPGAYEWIEDNGYVYIVKGKNKKLGILNKAGKLIVDTAFYAISPFESEHDFCWVSKDSVIASVNEYGCCQGNFGLINKDGHFVITPQFTEIRPFNGALIAIVAKAGNFGLINPKGDILLPFEFENITPANNGCFYLYREGKVGLADKNGKLVTKPVFDQIGSFNEDYARFFSEGKEGLISNTGKIIVPLMDNIATTEISLEELSFPAFYDRREIEDTNLSQYSSYNQKYNFELIDSLSDKTIRRIINNTVLAMVPDDDVITNEESESVFPCNYTLMTVNGYCSEKVIEYDNDYQQSYNYIKIKSQGEKYFSLIKEDEYSYRFTSYTYEFFNFRIENGKAIPVSLDYLFTLNYKNELNSIILQEIRRRDDIELDCNNPDAFLEQVKDRFTVSDKGIVFYYDVLSPDGFQESFVFAEIFIPFSALKNILRKN